MKVAIYVRVSKGDQEPDIQVQELKRFAAARGFTITDIYQDIITSNMRRRRGKATRYNDLLNDAREHRFDAVIVWKFDRFARSLMELLKAFELFEDLEIDFISFTQNIDTTAGPLGRLFFQVLGVIAEFERGLISERTMAGLRYARANGKKLGRQTGFAPRNKKRKHSVQRAPYQIDKMIRAYLAGEQIKQIARSHELPESTARHILRQAVCRLPCKHGKKYHHHCKRCQTAGRIEARPFAVGFPDAVAEHTDLPVGLERASVKK